MSSSRACLFLYTFSLNIESDLFCCIFGLTQRRCTQDSFPFPDSLSDRKRFFFGSWIRRTLCFTRQMDSFSSFLCLSWFVCLLFLFPLSIVLSFLHLVIRLIRLLSSSVELIVSFQVRKAILCFAQRFL